MEEDSTYLLTIQNILARLSQHQLTYIFMLLKRNDDKIYINYSKKEIVDDINDIQHDLVKECLKMTGIKSGIEITTLSDISSKGSGLGSSSAVTVGLLNALYCFKK